MNRKQRRRLNHKLAKQGQSHIKIGQETIKAEKYMRRQSTLNREIDEATVSDKYPLLDAKKNLKPYRDSSKPANLKGFWNIDNKYATSKKVKQL